MSSSLNSPLSRYFNPRSPHGERRLIGAAGKNRSHYFNPRSPHGERHKLARRENAHWVFQSTLPARGATYRACTLPMRADIISIHAPRTGSDILIYKIWFIIYNFNPRSPHGERQRFQDLPLFGIQFQSTLPARGATDFVNTLLMQCGISIHAPRTGSDILSN